MADVQSMCWIIPASIDMEGILKKSPPDFKYKIDYFYYIIDTITEASDLEDLDNNAGFVNLQAKRLQAFNHNYRKYIDYLLWKVIRRDGKYIPGKKSFGYCISVKHAEDGLQAIPIKDPIARRKIKAEYAEKKKNSGIKGKKYEYLTKWFNPQLKIDGKKAREKVEELFPPLTGAIRGTKKGQPSRTTKRYKSLVAIEKFEKQQFYNSVDGNIGRFHSNIANIKKELRQFITYNGQQLVNVDIKNSQPLFSTLLLSKAFYIKSSKPINIYNIPSVLPFINNTTNINKTITIIDHYIMIVESSENINGKGFQKYIDLVNSDDFYRRMASIIAPNKPYDKSEMKTMMFMVFFSSNRFIGQPQAHFKRLFKANFPDVYEVFVKLKKKNHAALSHLLQRIESNVIVERSARRIAEEHPNLPIFTVHDSIATILGSEEYVETVLKDEIYNYTGLEVKLGREYWI